MTRMTALPMGVVALLSAALATGIYLAQTPSTASSRHSPEQRAVTALVTGPPGAAAAEMPPSFVAVNHYRPRIEGGLLTDPGGECSSPVPLPAEFGPVCREHDLGYDLLRTAASTGRPLPAGARQAIDEKFAHDTHAACADRAGVSHTTCTAWADVATAAVEVNSWRQHWSVPGRETPLSITGTAAGILAGVLGMATAALGMAGLVTRARRAPRTAVRTPAGARP